VYIVTTFKIWIIFIYTFEFLSLNLEDLRRLKDGDISKAIIILFFLPQMTVRWITRDYAYKISLNLCCKTREFLACFLKCYPIFPQSKIFGLFLVKFYMCICSTISLHLSVLKF